MTFTIIGTGNIAWFFSSRIVAAGHKCKGVFGRNADAAKKLAEGLLVEKYGSIGDANNVKADVCFLAVSDAAIADVAAQLSFEKTVLVHTAGAMSIDSIAAAAQDRAVLWPVYSILRHNAPNHRNIPTAWEASSPLAKRYVLEMAHAITDVLFEAQYEQRKWLHLSAVIGNNFINHLMAICEKICADNKLPFSTIMPIITQTFDRIKTASPQTTQTGPAIRHEEYTIQQQVYLLSNHVEWRHIYEAITASIERESKVVSRK